ncbi:MAG: glycosyltransferase family 4 protein [Patescibacteria group bacterium]
MKIAILTPTFSKFSGIDRVVEGQSIELSNKGNKVDIYCLYGDIKLKNPNIEVIEIKKFNNLLFERIYRLLFFLDVFTISKYSKIISSYDVAYSHFYPINVIAYFAKKRNKKLQYIYYNHGVADSITFEKFHEKKYIGLIRILNNLSIKNADEIISISKYLAEVLKKETGKDSKVVYNKVDKDRYNAKPFKLDVRKKYKLPKDSFVILYVGRLSPHKKVDLLIKYFREFNKQYKDSYLIIVGKPTFQDYFKDLKTLANKHVIFTDFVSDKDLPDYYKACNIYSTCSIWEGFNLPIIEAEACGKPSVAFDLCSHPEVLKKGDLIEYPDTKNEFIKSFEKYYLLNKSHA